MTPPPPGGAGWGPVAGVRTGPSGCPCRLRPSSAVVGNLEVASPASRSRARFGVDDMGVDEELRKRDSG